MRILVSTFDYRPGLGGVATCGYELARALSELPGTEVRVIAPAQPGDAEFDRTCAFSTRRVPLSKSAVRSILPLAQATREEVARWQPDAVLDLLWHPNGIATAIALRGTGIPRYVVAHGVELLESQRTPAKRLRKRLATVKRRTLRGATRIFAVSRYTAALAEREGRLPADKVVVVPNGVRHDTFFPGAPPAGLGDSLGCAGKTVFLTVCRLVANKGVDVAIEALARTPANAILLVVGSGPDLERLQTLARTKGVAERVRFVTDVSADQLPAFYRIADCFLLLSREEPGWPRVEGFGIVFLEAAACAKPAIAGKSGGTADAVADEESGWLVDPVDVPGVAQAMRRVIENPELARAVGEKGLARSLASFTWTKSAQRIRDELASSNICFYSISTQLGGAERSLYDLVTRLEERSAGRYRPLVLVPKPEGPLLDQLRAAGIPTRVLPMPSGLLGVSRHSRAPLATQLLSQSIALLIYGVHLRKWLREARPRFVHCTGLKCHALAFFAYPSSRVIWHFRDILAPGITRGFFSTALRITKVHAIANSEATCRALGAPPSDCVHNGLDPRSYEPGKSNYLRERFGISSETRLVGMVGVLARWKGQAEFIRMASELVRAGSPAAFVIVGGKIYDTTGDAGYKASLEELVRELGLEGCIFFTGFEADSTKAMRSLDVLVHASIKPEPFGRVVLEAMALGIPVVASAAGGVLELVTDGETGLLYPPADVTAMASKVRDLLRDETLASRLSSAARTTFLEKFSLDRHVQAIIERYDRWRDE